MYRMTLTVSPVMDLMHVQGAVLEHTQDGEWRQVAAFSSDILLSDAWLTQDECTTLVAALRQWAEMTISA